MAVRVGLMTFAVDLPEVEGPWSPYLALHLIGLEVFGVEDWHGEDTVTVTSEWIPLPDLGFAVNGQPIALHALDDAMRMALMPWLGFEHDQPLTAMNLMERLSTLTGTTAGLMQLACAGLWLQAQTLLTEEERPNFVDELRLASEAWTVSLEDLGLPALTDVCMSDPVRQEALAGLQERVRQRLASSPCPSLVRRVLMACLEGSDSAELAEQLLWQSGSPHLAAARTHKAAAS